MGGIDRTKHQQ